MSHKINLVFLLTLFLYSLYCALQLGPSWDVLFNYNLGKIRLNYLLGLGFKDIEETAYVHKFYTGAYSTISAFFVQLFPKKYLLQSLYIINLIFSSLTIFGVYKITKELFNKRIGQIAFLLCYFNPIFFGHMAMNSMDTIIAFANIWFFYKINRPTSNEYLIMLNYKNKVKFLDGKNYLTLNGSDPSRYEIIDNYENCFFLKKI